MKANKRIYLFFLLVFLPITLAISQNRSQLYYSSMQDVITGGMEYLIIRHKVEDFDTWKKVFDQDKKRRIQEGLTDMLLLRDDNNLNEVTIILEFYDLVKAQYFVSDPELTAIMKKAGVLGRPEFILVKAKSSSMPVGNSFLMVRHRVKNYPEWKKVFDDHKVVRKKYGLTTAMLGTDIDDPNNVIILLNSSDTKSIHSFLEESDLKEVMENSELLNEPTINVMKQ